MPPSLDQCHCIGPAFHNNTSYHQTVIRWVKSGHWVFETSPIMSWSFFLHQNLQKAYFRCSHHTPSHTGRKLHEGIDVLISSIVVITLQCISIILHTLNIYNILYICQLYLNKAGKKKWMREVAYALLWLGPRGHAPNYHSVLPFCRVAWEWQGTFPSSERPLGRSRGDFWADRGHSGHVVL